MQICILSPIYPVSSNPHLGIFVHEQAKYLARKGNDVHVIALGDSKDREKEVREGVNVCRIKINKKIPFKRVFFSILMIKKLLSLNNKYNFDVIHSHFVGPLTALIGLASRIMDKPFVVTAHGIGMLNDKGLNKSLTRLYLSYPSKIICVSRYVAELASKFSSREKIVVINNGVDPEKLIPTKPASEFKKSLGIAKEKILLSVGNLVERKGIGIIINSLPEVVKSFPNLKYFIIGDGPEKENLQILVKNLRLEDKIVFIDYVNDNELANFYNISDIFVLMSRTIKEKEGVEGFGIVYAEASYFGKPVIGGKSGGTDDSIVDCVTGYRIEPENQKELAEKIVMLLENVDLRKKLGSNGKKRVNSKMLWGHNAEQLIRVYNALIKS